MCPAQRTEAIPSRARARVKAKGHAAPDRHTLLVGLILLAVVALIQLADPPPLSSLRLAVFDHYQRLAPRPYTPLPVRVVAIDDRSLAALGQWPWPRDVLARLVQRLDALGASAIAFDVVFAEPDRSSPRHILERLRDRDIPPAARRQLRSLPDFDQQLADAIAGAPVVLGFPGTRKAGGNRPALLAGMATAGSDPREFLAELPGAVANLPVLESNAAGQGSFALDRGEGGIVRRVPLVQHVNGALYPSLSLEALRVARDEATIILRASDASGEVNVGGDAQLQAVRVGDLEIPVTPDGRMWMHYTGPVDERYIPAADVLDDSNEQLKSQLASSIVLVGATAAGLKDLRATPLTNFQAGVSIHAQAVEQMLLGWHLERPGWARGAEVATLLLGGALLLWLLSRAGALASAALGGLAVFGGAGASWLAFTEFHLLLDPVYPGLAMALVYTASASLGYLRAEQDKRRLRQAFSSYLAPALVDRLVAAPERLRLSGESRDMTFLFTDIVDFTPFTETATPEELVGSLNQYLDRMCAIVMDHGGTIDKIVGDGIHAFFNAPLDQPDHPARAVACALALDSESRRLAAELPLGDTRIGINTGPAVVGNFGGRRRFDYTAHGDAVNTAARLESANRHLGTRICVSAATAKRCPEQRFHPVAELVLRGRTRAVSVLSPMAQPQSDSSLYEEYCRFYQRLEAGEPGLLKAADALQRLHPDDPLIALHTDRLRQGEGGVRIVLREK